MSSSFPAFLSCTPISASRGAGPRLGRDAGARPRVGGGRGARPARGLRMTNDWPEAAGPASELYSSRFPPWRLNQAPVVTVNLLGSEAANGVGVALREVRADPAEGEAVRNMARQAIRDAGPPGSPGPGAAEVVRRFYEARGRAVNEAPLVSVCGSAADGGRSVFVGMYDVAVNLARAKQILDDAVVRGPEGFWVREMAAGAAPFIRAAPESGVVVESATVPLDMIGAKLILDKYRR